MLWGLAPKAIEEPTALEQLYGIPDWHPMIFPRYKYQQLCLLIGLLTGN